MSISTLRIEPATGAIVLHARGGPAMRKLAVNGGQRVALYQPITKAGTWGPVVEADYSFAAVQRAVALALVDDADSDPAKADLELAVAG